MSEGDLSFFAALTRHDSLADAAREMGVTASAVSRRLARLEQRLGVRLMQRTTRRISLTGEGVAYAAKAQHLLSEIEELELSLRSGRENPSGLLRINATFGFSRAYIAPCVAEFSALYPNVEVQLIVTDAPLNLLEQSVDLNIRFGTPPVSGLTQRLLQRNRRFICAAPKYIERHGSPQTLDELADHDCIVLRQEHGIYDIWRFDSQSGATGSVRVKGKLSTNDGEMAREWMLAGHGLMLRSEWDVARHVREGTLRVVLPEHYQSANISAVYPDKHHLTAKVKLFIDALAHRVQAANGASPFQISDEDLSKSSLDKAAGTCD